MATQYFLAAGHLAGGVVLLASARQRCFTLLFAIMFLYAPALSPLATNNRFHISDFVLQGAAHQKT
jgi:hypothetical protein